MQMCTTCGRTLPDASVQHDREGYPRVPCLVLPVVVSEITKEEALAYVHALCQGGRWYCGATGNRGLAKWFTAQGKPTSTGDLATLVALLWNRIAEGWEESAGTGIPGQEQSIYRMIWMSQLEDLPYWLATETA